ncbi:hypothetical protein C8J57DRAFT_1293050 [Mycena rebaudengoi]|nr:hypothetical protein C8J57DRAFT_1293050 [Mycena rebaudengoi]
MHRQHARVQRTVHKLVPRILRRVPVHDGPRGARGEAAAFGPVASTPPSTCIRTDSANRAAHCAVVGFACTYGTYLSTNAPSLGTTFRTACPNSRSTSFASAAGANRQCSCVALPGPACCPLMAQWSSLRRLTIALFALLSCFPRNDELNAYIEGLVWVIVVSGREVLHDRDAGRATLQTLAQKNRAFGHVAHDIFLGHRSHRAEGPSPDDQGPVCAPCGGVQLTEQELRQQLHLFAARPDCDEVEGEPRVDI